MKIKNVIYSVFFIIILTFLLYFSVDTFASISTTVKLYIEKVFPSLFLFILFTNIMLNSNIIYLVADTISFIPRLLKLSKFSSIPIILGFLCGFPSASQAIDKLYKDRALSEKECNFLMAFCNNASPVFIISTVGMAMLNSRKVGTTLLIIHIVSSILIAILYKLFCNKYIIQENKVNLKCTTLNKENEFNNISIVKSIPTSIISTFKTMVYILAYMIIFNILADILNNLKFNIHYLTSTFELTKGLTFYTENINMPYISFLLGFSSFSIIFQIKSSLNNFKYPMYKIILFKLLQGTIAFILSLFIF